MNPNTLPEVNLRELTPGDVEDRYQWCLDVDVTRHLNMPNKYPPFSREETRQWIELCISRSNGYEQMAIQTDDGVHIGWVDIKNIDNLNKHGELGIAIGDKRYWGKGYGLAAMKAMLEYGFTRLGLNKIWLRVEVDNKKAIKSYRTMGFVEEGILRQDRLREDGYVDRLRMSILKEEFLGA
ncbi:GNAT family N-acetyltransferase [Bacillus salacetis]|uniref:GNAT family N-acetyltransferase n=1 Tax=Bacillus salacetis TaxID=2315464 RepID=UPI003B9FF223